MTVQGLIVLDLIGLVLLAWTLNLVRQNRLYVGYGVIFVLAISNTILILSGPTFLTFGMRVVGAIFPVSALTLLALCFIVSILIYVLTQVTLLSNRLAVLVQELAIKQAKEWAEHGTGREDSHVPDVKERL